MAAPVMKDLMLVTREPGVILLTRLELVLLRRAEPPPSLLVLVPWLRLIPAALNVLLLRMLLLLPLLLLLLLLRPSSRWYALWRVTPCMVKPESLPPVPCWRAGRSLPSALLPSVLLWCAPERPKGCNAACRLVSSRIGRGDATSKGRSRR